MSTVLDNRGSSITDLDVPIDGVEPLASVQSDSSNYGPSSLEFIIPSKQNSRVSDVSNEHNIKPSAHLTEADFRATAASRKLNIPETGPLLLDLIFWRRPHISAIVFASILILEFSLLVCSVISVVSTFILLLMMVSATMKVYYGIVNMPECNPLNYIANCDIRLTPGMSTELAQIITNKLNNLINFTVDLFLIRNIGHSVRFALLLYGLTYIGARFNFLTLCIWGTIAAFVAPKLVDTYKVTSPVILLFFTCASTHTQTAM
uniref:Reticulon-like protein n=1 Tax=Mesocestoides corti TaxID=53468 RepID=A0A5K3FZE1_MESCO